MAGLDPAIHVFLAFWSKDVDARLKAGHDELKKVRSLIGCFQVSNSAMPGSPFSIARL